MPKDQWARDARRAASKRGVKMEGWLRGTKKKPKRKPSKPARKRRARRYKPDPTPWVRPAYDDWPVLSETTVVREYDPLLYGRPVGSGWPVTVDGAQQG